MSGPVVLLCALFVFLSSRAVRFRCFFSALGCIMRLHSLVYFSQMFY